MTSALDKMMDELKKDLRLAFTLTEKSPVTRYDSWDVKKIPTKLFQKFVHHIEYGRLRTLDNTVCITIS